MTHRRRLTLLALLVGALLLLATPRGVEAHAAIDRAEPAPDSVVATAPRQVRISFTEPVAAGASTIEVLYTNGQRVDVGDSRVDLGDARLLTVTLHPLADGTYTVAWSNTSTVDGHPLRGSYAFTVGVGANGGASSTTASTPSSDLSPLDPFVRWPMLGGLLVALGIELFALLVLTPALATREARGVELRLDCRIVGGGLALAIVASLAHVGLQVMHGADIGTLISTRWGQMWALRLLLTAGALLAWWRGDGDRRATIATVVLLTAAASTFAFASHAAATRGLEVTAVANDLVHTLAAAAWTGGLVALFVITRAARALPAARRRDVLAAITTRFSPLVMIATGALLITGLYSTWLQVAAWSALSTPYGWAVLAKVAAYVALIAVAAVNLLWVTRCLHASQPLPTATRGASMLAVTVAVEVTLVLAALLAAGFLTSLEPARVAAGSGTRQAEATSGAIRVRVAVSPGSIGANRIEVHADDRGRAIPVGTSSVTLRVQFVNADIGAREVALQRDASGAFVAENVVLSLAGPWQFDVAVSSPGSFDTQVSVRLPMTPVGVVGIPLPQQYSALLAAGWQVIALALLVLVVSEVWWKRTRTAKIANWGGTGLIVAGIFMVYGVGHVHPGGAAIEARANPIATSEESIALGRELYMQHCVACHGLRGLGDGPAAAGLNPPPASLPLHVPLHIDGEIFAFIEAGLPGTAMPVFRDTLTEEQRWHLVNYLHTLKGAP